MSQTLVFVHGWSVTNVNTYGELPVRLRNEATARGLDIQTREIFLGKYISFNDAVQLSDISRAFRQAINDDLGDLIKAGKRFACITHSTGGPVIRDWWSRYCFGTGKECPMSHLIMLAPANYGSALAQLGKSRLSRIASWFDHVEPGEGVLNWLELGSADAWKLNLQWIFADKNVIDPKGIFPFVIAGECIDRNLYDHLNSYTGEIGSDGVVRVAAANLESTYIRLEQQASELKIAEMKQALQTPLRVVASKSHSGDKMGIMKSVKAADDTQSSETVNAIFDCLKVTTKADYDSLYQAFFDQTRQTQERERIEIEKKHLLSDRIFIHDRFSMVIFKITDSENHPVNDFDLILTGEDDDPDHLPKGFLVDRQRNRLSPETITYYFNYDIMIGNTEVIHNGEDLRKKIKGISALGMEIRPRPDKGFVRYQPCKIKANYDLFSKALKPNCTTLIEIKLQRLVSNEVFRLQQLTGPDMPGKKEGDFKNVKPGTDVVA